MRVQSLFTVTSFTTLALVFSGCSSSTTDGVTSNVNSGGSTVTGTPTGAGMTSSGGSTSSGGMGMVTGSAGMGNAGTGMVTGNMGGMGASAGSSMGGSTMGGASMGGMGGMTTGMAGMASAGMATGGMGGSSGGTGGAGVGGNGMAGGGGTSGGEFTLTSAELTEGESFDAANTCTGGGGELGFGVSISLEWSGFPAETKSFALTMVDVTLVDGTAMDYLGCHSFFYNLPASVTSLPAGGWGDTLTGAGATPFRSGYLGPCPPNGPDTYEFTLYALPDESFTPAGNFMSNLAACNELRQSLEDAAIDKAVLSGTYIQP